MERILSIFVVPADQIINFFISMGLAVVLGMLIALVYRYTHRGMNYESGFLSTIVLLSPIVALVMFFIQGDLVLSLGLVGSLAIIRFRTPIKDTRDMVFLFWSIAIGLGVGTLNWTVAVFATLFLSVLMSGMYLFKYGRSLHVEYILVVAGSDQQADDDIERVVARKRANVQLRNHEVDGSDWELTYEIRVARAREPEVRGLVSELQKIHGVTKVSLLTPQLALPM
ncbi:MAG: DUF4956 domain-containing protein [Spirochaetaceae bacterium]|nr:MAG: DUF4956 domain-containing protein [Spirochaetaceae bacterium]